MLSRYAEDDVQRPLRQTIKIIFNIIKNTTDRKAPAGKVNTSYSQRLGLGRADYALSAKSDMICEALPESLIHEAV